MNYDNLNDSIEFNTGTSTDSSEDSALHEGLLEDEILDDQDDADIAEESGPEKLFTAIIDEKLSSKRIDKVLSLLFPSIQDRILRVLL